MWLVDEMTDRSMTLFADAARLLEKAARCVNEEQRKVTHLQAAELIASAHAEAEVVVRCAEQQAA